MTKMQVSATRVGGTGRGVSPLHRIIPIDQGLIGAVR